MPTPATAAAAAYRECHPCNRRPQPDSCGCPALLGAHCRRFRQLPCERHQLGSCRPQLLDAKRLRRWLQVLPGASITNSYGGLPFEPVALLAGHQLHPPPHSDLQTHACVVEEFGPATDLGYTLTDVRLCLCCTLLGTFDVACCCAQCSHLCCLPVCVAVCCHAAVQSVAEITYMKNMGLPFAGWMSDEDCAPMMLVATDTSISASGLACLQEMHAVWTSERAVPTTFCACRLLLGQPTTAGDSLGPSHPGSLTTCQCQLPGVGSLPSPSPA